MENVLSSNGSFSRDCRRIRLDVQDVLEHMSLCVSQGGVRSAPFVHITSIDPLVPNAEQTFLFLGPP